MEPQLAANRSVGFAVEVVDKQGNDSPFLVIEDSKKGVDTLLLDLLPLSWATLQMLLDVGLGHGPK